jgi:hypothetical protein
MRVAIDFEKETAHLALESDASTIRLEKVFSLTKAQSDWWNSIPADVKNEAIWSVSAGVRARPMRRSAALMLVSLMDRTKVRQER